MAIKVTNCKYCNHDNFDFEYRFKKFNILRCRNCGILYRDIKLIDQEAVDLYSSKYFLEEQKEYFRLNREDNFRIKTISQNANLIKKTIGKGKILDFGCGTGLFLKKAQEHGFEVYGYEISEYASDYARNEYHLEVFRGNGELADARHPSEFFDAVTFFDSIDHPEKPFVVLKEAKRILKNDGIIVVSTTVEDSLLFYLAKFIYKISLGLIKYPAQRGHPVHHSFFCTSKKLKKILEDNGFEIVYKSRQELPAEYTSISKFTPLLKIEEFFARLLNLELEYLLIGKKTGLK